MKKAIWIIIILILAVLGMVLYYNYRMNEGLRFVKSMGSGINIGNSLDSTRIYEIKENASVEYYETYWNNPPITKDMFLMIKEAGFGTVRIPVSWDEHMNSEGRLDDEWLDRVEEVVEYGLDQGLYIILDTHHESWLVPLPEKEEETTKKLCVLWKQISERFSDYPTELLFEGMNEPRTVGSEEEWNGGTEEERKVVNRLNDAFIETVRKTGGNNKSRWLIITSYGGNHEEAALKELEIPEDNRIIVAVHAYIPYKFTQDEEGTFIWSEENIEDTKPIDELMERLDLFFIQKKVPVILTEFGCKDKENTKERVAWAEYYTEKAKKNKMICIWWDEGAEYSLMDRINYKWKEPELVKILVR